MRPLALLFAAAFLAASALPAAAQGSYQCSGIGTEEREAADSVPHTLRLEFAEPGGHYLGNVAARITRGGDEVVAVTCPGPWLLADLPDGRYEVTASIRGQSKTVHVTIQGGKRQRVVMVF